jgi:hypothetical protein
VTVEQQSVAGLEPQGFTLVSSKECRVRALECARLAQASASAKERKTFAELVRIWLRLAFVLQQTQSNQTIKQEPATRTDRSISRVLSEGPKSKTWPKERSPDTGGSGLLRFRVPQEPFVGDGPTRQVCIVILRGIERIGRNH